MVSFGGNDLHWGADELEWPDVQAGQPGHVAWGADYLYQGGQELYWGDTSVAIVGNLYLGNAPIAWGSNGLQWGVATYVPPPVIPPAVILPVVAYLVPEHMFAPIPMPVSFDVQAVNRWAPIMATIWQHKNANEIRHEAVGEWQP